VGHVDIKFNTICLYFKYLDASLCSASHIITVINLIRWPQLYLELKSSEVISINVMNDSAL